MTRPSRLTALNSKLVDSIKPGSRAKIEALVNDQLPISTSPAEVSNLLFAIAKNHSEDFIGGPSHGPANPDPDPRVQPTINDVRTMTAIERLEWVHRFPAAAEAARLAAKK